jgi:hypothetical protein
MQMIKAIKASLLAAATAAGALALPGATAFAATPAHVAPAAAQSGANAGVLDYKPRGNPYASPRQAAQSGANAGVLDFKPRGNPYASPRQAR